MWPLIVLGLIVAFFAGFCVYIVRAERKAALTWKLLGEGSFDCAKYGYYTYSRRHGAMVHHTTYHKMDVTAVYLEDGRSFTGTSHADMPFPKGAPIRILRNGNGRIRVEKGA